MAPSVRKELGLRAKRLRGEARNFRNHTKRTSRPAAVGRHRSAALKQVRQTTLRWAEPEQGGEE